jgi:hypothetical protein
MIPNIFTNDESIATDTHERSLSREIALIFKMLAHKNWPCIQRGCLGIKSLYQIKRKSAEAFRREFPIHFELKMPRWMDTVIARAGI